jgi:hypothetical protein
VDTYEVEKESLIAIIGMGKLKINNNVEWPLIGILQTYTYDINEGPLGVQAV